MTCRNPVKSRLLQLFAVSVMLISFALSTHAAGLEVATVRSSSNAASITADGVVEAVRQTVIAAQVSGAITELPVKAGDSMKSGQMLARLDSRAAIQQVHASQAQVEAARAALQVAARDFERQKQLFAQKYISQAQLDRAEAQFKSATADANTQIAQAATVQTQSSFYALTAPYAGKVADVFISLGDMVTPGRALISVFDPAALRVTATLAQAQLSSVLGGTGISIEIPGLPAARRHIKVDQFTALPVTDASTHTVQLRFELPSGIEGLAPGMFARVLLPAQNEVKGENARLYIPSKAIFHRAELYAVYVVNGQGKAMLRQVKPGPILGNEQEILAGLDAGENVALNPLLAAQSR